MFPKLSFRHLLLGVFLLIAVLLSATSVHALLTLDRLAAHSREAGQHAIALTENAQRLAERSVAMERSARQFLVLDDPAFRQRYAEACASRQPPAGAEPGPEPGIGRAARHQPGAGGRGEARGGAPQPDAAR